MKRLSRSISILALAGLAGGSALADEDDVTAWRLFVSDHAEPIVNVIDALDGDKLHIFSIKGLHRFTGLRAARPYSPCKVRPAVSVAATMATSSAQEGYRSSRQPLPSSAMATRSKRPLPRCTQLMPTEVPRKRSA